LLLTDYYASTFEEVVHCGFCILADVPCQLVVYTQIHRCALIDCFDVHF
jgi:hypothetical protein